MKITLLAREELADFNQGGSVLWVAIMGATSNIRLDSSPLYWFMAVLVIVFWELVQGQVEKKDDESKWFSLHLNYLRKLPLFTFTLPSIIVGVGSSPDISN